MSTHSSLQSLRNIEMQTEQWGREDESSSSEDKEELQDFMDTRMKQDEVLEHLEEAQPVPAEEDIKEEDLEHLEEEAPQHVPGFLEALVRGAWYEGEGLGNTGFVAVNDPYNIPGAPDPRALPRPSRNIRSFMTACPVTPSRGSAASSASGASSSSAQSPHTSRGTWT